MSTLNDIIRTCAAGQRKDISWYTLVPAYFKGEDWEQQVKHWAKTKGLHVSFNGEYCSCTFYPFSPPRSTDGSASTA